MRCLTSWLWNAAILRLVGLRRRTRTNGGELVLIQIVTPFPPEAYSREQIERAFNLGAAVNAAQLFLFEHPAYVSKPKVDR